MTYQELSSFYKSYFSLIKIPHSAKTKLELINLICYTIMKVKKKITVYELLTEKVYKGGSDYIPELKALSCICEDLLSDANLEDFNNYGLEDAKSILTRIKQILDDTLPF